MKIDYEPHRLHLAVKEVQKTHPLIGELASGKSATDTENFIRRICSLTTKELNVEKLYLPYRRYIQMAIYLASGNYYSLNHSNLIILLSETFDERIFRILFHGWQHLYDDSLFQNIFLQLLRKNTAAVNNALKNDYLFPMEQYLLKWIVCHDPAYQIGADCLKASDKRTEIFDTKLHAIGIDLESALGRKCIEEFYTFCNRVDYLKVSILELGKIVQNYTEQLQKSFLSNFLSEMQRDDFKGYYELGKFFLRQTGECGTEKSKRYFSEFSNIQVEKYRIWQNLIKIRESFSEDEKDERIVFWDRYAEYGEFIINKYSQSVTIAFPRYCIVEFMQKTMGLSICMKKVFTKHPLGR
ncbi:MAG: hypothetical protein PUH02_05840 [bacterium]|nr:hypothetical protein [bacterium]